MLQECMRLFFFLKKNSGCPLLASTIHGENERHVFKELRKTNYRFTRFDVLVEIVI